ncbi:MAG: hydrogen gas-evolving membrane-bound hydrogenase subunit E [Candidatus Bipolaricaulaceae bacterium]
MTRWLTVGAFLLVAGWLLWGAVMVRPFGAPSRVEMDAYFNRFSQPEVAANNAVTAIVFDYRGYDTLGEATVLFTAVTGVALLLRRRGK